MFGLSLVLASLQATSGCSGSEQNLPPAESGLEQVDSLSPGQPATLYLTNDSVATGIAVKIRSADGTEAFGLFRGPHRLGESITNGTWTFNADSLPSRVRVVGNGERLVGGA
jgi:hypothetical protein